MQLLVTALLLALLIVGIIRKLDLRILFLGDSVLGLLWITVSDGSVMGGDSCGSAVIDILCYIARFLSSNIGGIVFTMMVVIAYIEVIHQAKAIEALTYILKKPLKLIRGPYMMVAAVIVLGVLMRTCIGLAPVHAALMCALFVPVLLSFSCPFETTAAAMLVPMALSWGPADTNYLSALEIMGLEVDMVQFFVSRQIPVILLMTAVMTALFILFSKRFDNKHHTLRSVDEDSEGKPDAPLIYALMPLLPMLVMLVPLLVLTLSVEIVPACLLSLFIAMVITVVCRRRWSDISVMLKTFFSAFAENLKSLGFIVLLAMLFAAVLGKIGGIGLVAQMLTSLSISPLALVLLICLLGGTVNMIIGSFFGALSIVLPLAAVMTAETGLDEATLCYLVLISCQVGGLTSPVNPVVLTVSDRCGIGVDELIKRIALPAWISLIAVILLSGTMFRV